MNNDLLEKTFVKHGQLVEIPLYFHATNKENQKDLKSPISGIVNDTQYKVRLMRYTAHLINLLDQPEVAKSKCCSNDERSDVYHEQVDNYLWVMGEIINNMFEMNKKSHKE